MADRGRIGLARKVSSGAGNERASIRIAVHRACRIAVVLGSTLFAACSKAPAAPSAVFEMAEVVAPGTRGALTLRPWISSSAEVQVAEPVRFTIERAQVQPGSLGDPGLLFEVTETDRAAFHDWTKAHVGRSVAFLADRQVLCVASMNVALNGVGQLDFGSDRPDPALLRAMAERLAPER